MANTDNAAKSKRIFALTALNSLRDSVSSPKAAERWSWIIYFPPWLFNIQCLRVIQNTLYLSSLLPDFLDQQLVAQLPVVITFTLFHAKVVIMGQEFSIKI